MVENTNRVTLYVNRDEFKRFVAELQVEYKSARSCEKRDIHEAILHVAEQNPDELLEALEGNSDDSGA